LIAQGNHNGIWPVGYSADEHEATRASAYDSDSSWIFGGHDSCKLISYETNLDQSAPLAKFMYLHKVVSVLRVYQFTGPPR
jgi:hypothetical protein